MQILDGKTLSEQIKKEIKSEVADMVEQGYRPPHLATIFVGDNPASEIYVRNKIKSCESCGFTTSLYKFDNDVSFSELLDCIQKLNKDDNVDGFIVQLPLPAHINECVLLEEINHKKDVDGFHSKNLGRLLSGIDGLVPATPRGIVELLKHNNVELCGKTCVIIGRSNIVGKPLAMLMLQEDCSVIVCHSKSKNLKELCLSADIIVVATGRPKTLTADMVKDGCVIVDVGTNWITEDGKTKLVGDVDFDGVSKKCSMISPVPGGVRPMTIAMLMRNTMDVYLGYYK